MATEPGTSIGQLNEWFIEPHVYLKRPAPPLSQDQP